MSNVTSHTIREIDAFIEEHAGSITAILAEHLAKIRAHAEADELERKRLQAEMLLASGGFTEAKAAEILDLSPGWRMAPQEMRRAAHLMSPVRICARSWPGDAKMICYRAPLHTGEHCPDEGCKTDHG